MSAKMRQRGRRNIVTGKVVSSHKNKTISVSIYSLVKHPKYKKYIKKTSVFKAHDENNQAKSGDIVRILETRALSKTKRWKLIQLVQSGKALRDAGHDKDIVGYSQEKKKKAQELGSQQNHLEERMKGNFSDEEIDQTKKKRAGLQKRG